MNAPEINESDANRIPPAPEGASAPALPQQWPPSPTPDQERALTTPGRPARATGGGYGSPNAHPAAPGLSAPGMPARAPAPAPAPAPHQPSQQTLPALGSVQTLGTWALVLGIVSVFFNPLAGLSIAAGVCGIIALVRYGDLLRAGVTAPGRGIAIAGVVLAVAGLMRTSALGWFII